MWSMSANRSNLYEIVAEGASKRERERGGRGREREEGREGGVGVINQNEISKMKPIILPAEIQEL